MAPGEEHADGKRDDDERDDDQAEGQQSKAPPSISEVAKDADMKALEKRIGLRQHDRARPPPPDRQQRDHRERDVHEPQEDRRSDVGEDGADAAPDRCGQHLIPLPA